MNDKITIRGARQHNLKNINLELPKNKLIVFTGLSGSGKSSMAFDTIYAEGQRRYVESLSSYARQFLGVMDKPDVDAIDGLSPAISIDQKSTSHNPRSTVGTITEIYDYLRLLYARIGHPHCTNCGREISRQTLVHITEATMNLIEKLVGQNGKKPVRILVMSPLVRDRKGEFKDLFENLNRKGFRYIRIDKHVYTLEEDIILIKTNKHTIEVVTDRITAQKSDFRDEEVRKTLRSRLADSLEQAVQLSEGLVVVGVVEDSDFDFPDKPKKISDHLFSERFACPVCNISIPEIEPRIFSFNSPHGACQKCNGIGNLQKIDPELIINPRLTILEGGILPFARTILSDSWYGRILLAALGSVGINPAKPLAEINAIQKNYLIFGTGDQIHAVSGQNRYGKEVVIHETFKGIVPELERRYQETESDFVRDEIGKYMREELCPSCLGYRLKKEALGVTIGEKSIVDITSVSISQTLEWIIQTFKKFDLRDKAISNLIIKEISTRLTFLISVGLDYLTLGRGAATLAGGESQRIRLASQIGSGLTGVLYVLDEPSIGLHPRDNFRLIETLKKLKELGNTVLVVEHDREMMQNADFIVDFGPLAGDHGGKVMATGTYDEICKNELSLTGKYLTGKKQISFPSEVNKDQIIKSKQLIIEGCTQNNLKNLSLTIPLHKLVSITGVSGSGKSTLIVDTLYQAIARILNPLHREKAGKYKGITGIEYLNRIILVDQSPIGRTPRSNPATYTGLFTVIRDLYSQTPYAKARGYKAGRFSFNVKGGRCDACEGEGVMKIEMQFMPDVYVTCDVCRGTRFNSETLEVKFKDRSISDVLAMTVEEASKFFINIPGLSGKLETLNEVGLSYIHLGQPAPQLSGGEAQRVKLATELSKHGSRNTLYILDEPTTGLHFEDLKKLLHVLKKLVNFGNSVVVIEHNLDIIKNSDWVIDLGPEGGDKGGRIIAEATPADLKKIPQSYTGIFLKKYPNKPK